MLLLAGITMQQHKNDATRCYTFMGCVRKVALSKYNILYGKKHDMISKLYQKEE
jgi:hypothetical protein